MSKLRIIPTIALFVFFAVGVFSASAGQPVPTVSPPPSPYDPASHGVPSIVAGHKVLAVFSSSSTVCMPSQEKRLVLQATEESVEEFLKHVQPEAAERTLDQLGLTRTTQWIVQYAGPDTKLQDLLAENEAWNRLAMNGGECLKGRPAKTGSDWQEFKGGSGMPGYALFEDTDAGSYTDDNAQAVDMYAPSSIGTNQNAYSLFMNNVRTVTGYFLQNGFVFNQGAGRVVWASTATNYALRDYNIPYRGGRSYWFTITNTNNRWFMCGRDNQDPGTYQCIEDRSATGGNLALSTDTSIFAENLNTNSNWYSGFTNPWRAENARIYRNGQPYNWSSNHRHTIDACSTSWPPSNALSGSLASGGTGYIYLAGVPLRCY